MHDAEPRRLSHRALFTGFFQAGVLGFGGVLPVARRMIVDERKWLTQAQFNDLFALCQFMPGANVVNFAFAFGARHRGWSGAAAAILGLLGAPVGIVMALGAVYARFGTLPVARHALAGLAAAAAGLVLGTALKIATPIFNRPRNVALAGLVFGLVLFAHVSLIGTIALVLPVALLLAWRFA
ncbi:MAG: chromate transporter [Rhodospirillales bacterium 20-64-7]|nr:MAG: chromate transporter [Rhodospirillales bacterium 20-64-7]